MNAQSPTPSRQRPSPEAVDAVIRELTALFGNRVVTSQAVREQHGSTLT